MRWYAHVPDWIDRPLLAGAARLRALAPGRAGVERLTGRGLTVERVGRSAAIDYFLDGVIGHDRHVAPADATPDLFVTRGDRRRLAHRFGARGWCVPEVVGAVVPLPAAGDGRAPWVNPSTRGNIRRIRKHELTWSLSHDRADFDFFYHHMYRPYTAARFADQQSLRSEHRMYRRFRAGALLWVHQGDRRLAAALIGTHQQIVRSWAFAPNPEHVDAVKLGALAATYVFTFEWALSRGYRAVDLGASRASLTDGVLIHKRSWGAVVAPEPGVDWAMHVDWPRMTPAIARCLHAMPLVVLEGGGLAGLAALPTDVPAGPETVEDYLWRIAMPGLARLHVIADPDARCDVTEVRGVPIRWLTPDRP